MPHTTSIIIITYNSASTIGACLDAVRALEPQGAYEVVVLDNASQDDSAACVRAQDPSARLVVERENWGFAGGVNRAVAAAQGEYILLLNPDAVPDKGWAAALVDALSAPAVGVVGSKVLEPDGNIQSVGSLLDERALLTSHRGGGEIDSGQYDTPTDVWSVHGAAMGFSKALWQQLGGFDEGFFPAYWEESDFCQRARQVGKRVIVVPQAVVRHTEASSTGKYSAQFYGYYHRNRLRYGAKWLDWPTLWEAFRPAEHARLATAPPLDRRVARLVYERGVPALDPLSAAGREDVRAWGYALAQGRLPNNTYEAVLAHLHEAEQNSVHRETVFTSRIGALSRLRTAWNNIATRWYVRPNFDQQTRFNLAAQRTLAALLDEETTRAAATALDVALLSWKVGSSVER
jgi:GT2 family glycosyltransferase